MKYSSAHFSPLFISIVTLLSLSTVFSLPVETSDFLDGTEARHLAKRGCIVYNGYEFCDEYSVATQAAALVAYGAVPQKDCLFYLGLGGEVGALLGYRWYCSERSGGRGAVSWTTSLDPDYLLELRAYLMTLYNLNPDNLYPDPDALNGKPDETPFRVFSELHAQALAETCNGDVYFFTPQSNAPSNPIDNVWWNYEYPALTRNPNINSILRVDPTLHTADGGYADAGTIIWTQGDSPSALSPAGTGYTFTATLFG